MGDAKDGAEVMGENLRAKHMNESQTLSSYRKRFSVSDAMSVFVLSSAQLHECNRYVMDFWIQCPSVESSHLTHFLSIHQ